MLTDRQLALAAEWLVPSRDLPWQWDAEGEAIHWHDGATVVFREELGLIVERCADRGLPPAGPLVLALAGCRSAFPAPQRVAEQGMFGSPPSRSSYQTFVRVSQLADLPEKIVGGVPGRAALMRHLFAEVSPVRDEQTAAVLAFFRAELPIKALPVPAYGGREDSLRTCLHTLAVPLEKLAPQILALLRETGLTALPEAAEIELPATPNLGRLFNDMENDPELSPVLRVARDVMAAVSLPEALAEPDEEMLGGVSDIGNRGPLHRLLLSELAHDDDTLAIRIALNEALYLRREPASHQPPGTLAILLDVGVRMWGTPRVFAVSTALAFLAKAPKHALPAIFRSQGNAVAPVELRTCDGVAAQLAALDPALHAGPSLAALARSLDELKGRLDLVIVTHSATAEDREFLEALGHFPVANIFLAALDREGRLTVRRRTAHGWRTLTEARIDVRALGAPRPVQRTPPGSLPAILGLRPFPFLLSPIGHITRRCALADGRRAFLFDTGEVWIFAGERRGARRLLGEPIGGTVLHFAPDRTSGRLGVVSWRSNESILEMHSEHLDGATMSVAQRGNVRACPLRVDLRDGVLFAVFPDHAEAMDMVTGAAMGSLKLTAGMRAVGGRYLLVPQPDHLWRIAALAWNGAALESHLLPFVSPKIRKLASRIILVFDRSGRETPWALSCDGWLFPVDAQKDPALRVEFDGLVREAEASHRGDRIWLRETVNKQHMTDLTGEDLVEPCMSWHWDKQYVENVHEPRRWAHRLHFSHAGIDHAGFVLLRSVKGYWIRIAIAPVHGTFQFHRLPNEGSGQELASHRAVAFRPLQTPADLHVSLKAVEWPDGSRAFLDSRGLLHLQSSDPAVPEITFVLAESVSVPAWSSDGHILGPRFFLGDRKQTDRAATIIATHLQSFAARIR